MCLCQLPKAATPGTLTPSAAMQRVLFFGQKQCYSAGSEAISFLTQQTRGRHVPATATWSLPEALKTVAEWYKAGRRAHPIQQQAGTLKQNPVETQPRWQSGVTVPETGSEQQGPAAGMRISPRWVQPGPKIPCSLLIRPLPCRRQNMSHDL